MDGNIKPNVSVEVTAEIAAELDKIYSDVAKGQDRVGLIVILLVVVLRLGLILLRLVISMKLKVKLVDGIPASIMSILFGRYKLCKI